MATCRRSRLGAITLMPLLGAAACGGDATSAGQGATGQSRIVEYEMVTRLDPGAEVEHCKFVQAPPEGLNINRQQIHYTTGSHHVLLFETSYWEIPTEKNDGTEVDTSDVFDCTDGATRGWSVSQLVGGSQNADGSGFSGFPEGVAKPIAPGAVLLMNAHYVNSSSEVLEPEVNIKLHSIPDAAMKQEGDLLFWYNIFIEVPAQSQARARMRCEVHEDIKILSLQSHMHARGVDYQAREVGGALLYENDRWEDVPVGKFDDGYDVAAGSYIDYFCDYDNPSMQDIYQGPRTTDEMCMLVGAYYPADRKTSVCGLDTPLGVISNVAGDWVGNGSATCGETLECLRATDFDTSNLEDVTTCMVNAQESAAADVSRALRCMTAAKRSGGDADAACADEIASCTAH